MGGYNRDSLKRLEGHEESFEGGKRLVVVHLVEADEGILVNREEAALDDIVGEKLHDSRFESMGG